MHILKTAIASIILCYTGATAIAQHTHNHTHSMVTKRADTSTAVPDTLYFPDFYKKDSKVFNDTTWTFELYDHDNHKVMLQQIKTVEDIDHISYYKSFAKSSSKTGQRVSAPYIYELIYKYVQPGPDQWIRLDSRAGLRNKYKVNRKKIVRTEQATFTDFTTKKPRTITLRYFKTTILAPEKI